MFIRSPYVVSTVGDALAVTLYVLDSGADWSPSRAPRVEDSQPMSRLHLRPTGNVVSLVPSFHVLPSLLCGLFWGAWSGLPHVTWEGSITTATQSSFTTLGSASAGGLRSWFGSESGLREERETRPVSLSLCRHASSLKPEVQERAAKVSRKGSPDMVVEKEKWQKMVADHKCGGKTGVTPHLRKAECSVALGTCTLLVVTPYTPTWPIIYLESRLGKIKGAAIQGYDMETFSGGHRGGVEPEELCSKASRACQQMLRRRILGNVPPALVPNER
ncbi:hypothetical protein BJY52DRAFT_1226700 [Lactarius psammicola]|nr:hypothetical protein BJY52DRAFT_1226700 [Lactarius psammicola]